MLPARTKNKVMSGRAAAAAFFLGGLMLASAGCGAREESAVGAQDLEQEEQRTEPTGQESGNDTEVSAFYKTGESGGSAEEKEEMPEPQSVPYTAMDISGILITEEEAGSGEDGWISSSVGGMPPDTVEYVPSSREEILETVYEESTVDENDPDTYRIIEYEQEVPVILEEPTEYTDSAGMVRYALQDGIWYEYLYGAGEVALDTEDEELALLLLNMDGAYDDYELMELNCEYSGEEGDPAAYSYHVLYRKTIELEGAPEEVEHLSVTKTEQTQSMELQTVQEKVPVMVSREEPTGAYRYFGWQEEEGKSCYYDEDGNRVTGAQVIRGIRCEFDRDGYLISRSGVDVSSRNGTVDWEKVHAAGIRFAMVRGGYRGTGNGELILDGEAGRNLEGAAAVGISTGVYIYSQAVNELEAVEEASLAVALAREYGTDMPLALKMDTSGPSYAGRADGLSPEDRTKIAEAFCETVRNAGYEPMIFAGENWIANNLEALENVTVWYAADDADHSDMDGCEIWQYTAKGTVDGITGDVGVNISCEMQQ